MAIYEGRFPIEKIKDKGEYEAHKEELEHFLSERYWLKHTDNPLVELKNTIMENLNCLDHIERGSEEEKALLHTIHLQEIKFDMIKDGSYESVLMDNIKAETMMLDEFEQATHYHTRWEYIKGILKGEESARKLVGYSFLRSTGRMVTPAKIDITPRSKALFDFAHKFGDSFVEIDGKELENTAKEEMGNVVSLVTYQEAGMQNGIERRAEKDLNTAVSEVLHENDDAKVLPFLNHHSQSTGHIPQQRNTTTIQKKEERTMRENDRDRE